ncbi:MAG: hypothetical protein WC716_16670 [Chitinophagaceae bacterium]|jgi:hypothetical protein
MKQKMGERYIDVKKAGWRNVRTSRLPVDKQKYDSCPLWENMEKAKNGSSGK